MIGYLSEKIIKSSFLSHFWMFHSHSIADKYHWIGVGVPSKALFDRTVPAGGHFQIFWTNCYQEGEICFCREMLRVVRRLTNRNNFDILDGKWVINSLDVNIYCKEKL